VYALDLPGHGRSEGAGFDTVTDYAEGVAAFLAAIRREGSSPPTLIGHSMGGAIAMKMALDFTDQVSRLVLVASGARLRVAPAILEGIQTDFERALELVTRFAWSSEAPPRLSEMGRKALRDVGPEVLLGDFSACDCFDVMERLGEIRVPTLVIVGSADQFTPLKYAHFLTKHIPDAHLAVIEGAGHMVALERPADVAHVAADFLGLNPQH
jgi:pimeloyl-ACP methyl ester carboxylesterase